MNLHFLVFHKKQKSYRFVVQKQHNDKIFISGWTMPLNLAHDLQRNIQNQKYQISVILALFIHYAIIN